MTQAAEPLASGNRREQATLDADGGAVRGKGAAPYEATFRDPEPPTAEADALRAAIAERLVRAPKLPIKLPAFGVTLLTVDVDRRGIDLVVGWDAPIAAIRLRPLGKGDLVPLGPKGRQPVVEATVREIHQNADRVARELSVMATRVAASITRPAWDLAWADAKTLLRLPVGVPLGFFRQLIAGLGTREGMVRTGFLCNQDCGICWQGRDWGRFGPDQVLTWIEDLRAAGAASLIISGGEPTLDPELPRYIRHARSIGIGHVTLETNAIQFAKPGLAEVLRDAGLSVAFVSLHSSSAEVSDAITRAPGTHARTVRGILSLLEAKVPVKLNAVMTQEGLSHLAELPDFIHDTFGAHRSHLVGLMLSYPSESYDSALSPTIMPEPTMLRRVLRETIDRAFALGLDPHGLDGPCGPQLCAFGADRRLATLRPIPEAVDFRGVYLPACDDCAVRHACFGLRDTDVALYGDACVEPLASSPEPAPSS